MVILLEEIIWKTTKSELFELKIALKPIKIFYLFNSHFGINRD